jgi:hypothetical protein
VVIELKKGSTADKVFGQVCRYIGCIKEDHADDGEEVRGFIVGREMGEKLKYADKATPVGLVALQVFDFKGEKGKKIGYKAQMPSVIPPGNFLFSFHVFVLF